MRRVVIITQVVEINNTVDHLGEMAHSSGTTTSGQQQARRQSNRDSQDQPNSQTGTSANEMSHNNNQAAVADSTNEIDQSNNNDNSDQCDSPFNIYNTEIVKFDARAATMTPSGDLVRQTNDLEIEDLEQFSLLDPDYDVSSNHSLQQRNSADSVAVNYLDSN